MHCSKEDFLVLDWAESQHFVIVHDDNSRVASMPYFGVIEEIWELNYVKFIVYVFKCKWFDSNIGVRTDETSLCSSKGFDLGGYSGI